MFASSLNSKIPMSYREVLEKMRKFSGIIFILLCLALSACVPQSPKSGRKSAKASAIGADASPTPSAPSFSGSIYWYNGQIINGTLDLPDTFSSVVYVRGESINNFLAQTTNAMNAVYCLVVGFNTTGAKDQFRARAVPITFNNFQTGQLERLLRVDVNLSTSECQGNVGNLGTLSAKAPFYHSSDRVYLGVSNGITGKGLYYSQTPSVSFASRSFDDVKDTNGAPLLSNNVTSVYAHNNTVAVGTQSGLGLSYDNALSFSAPALFKNKNISTIGGLPGIWGVASGNQLWLTGNDGVSFNPTSIDASNPTIRKIVGHDGPTDYLFIATNNGLWYSTNSGASFQALTNTPTNGLATAAGTHTLYAATNSGVNEYNISGGVPIFVRNINSGDGLGSNTINDVAVSNTDLYIATTAGLSIGAHPGGLSFPNSVLSGGEPKAVSANATKAAVTLSGGGSLFYIGSTPSAPALITQTLDLADICPTCSSLTSNSVALYQVQASSIDDTTRVATLDAVFGSLNLRVSGGGNTGGGGTCNNGACQAQGYDCCLDNQCVIDGSQRPGASSQANYNQAIQDVSTNPQLFVNYPEVYYVCTQSPPPNATPTPLPDAIATAAARLQEEYAQYLCLEGAKLDPPDYSSCIDGDGDSDHDIDDWHLVRLRVWDRCGCEAEPLQEPYCPDYGLTAVVDSNNEPISVSCLIPPPDAMPTPFQNLTINLPARTVPHRFFRSVDGAKVDDISTISNISPEIVPEGTPFAYLDDSGKTIPIEGPFSMNSILGQMSVQLTHALPAKVIKLEFGADYIISGTAGLYTPCPQCSRDAWFDSFTAFPSSTTGLGVQPVGYSTRRDLHRNNTSLGNYEDTIFGRACWLPPTMVPYSHMPRSSVPVQRQARLKTQAALWANGYQRDWFGFNKGALIGSFDGVKWFAVGGGRRVTSTSETLFLAINSPFGDLTENSSITVNVVADLGGNEAAQLDFDPSLNLNDPRQNRAGSCQRFHMCEKDVDCISRLGWEYTCANVGNTNIAWPRFNAVGDEITGEANNFLLEDIVFANNGLPGGTKRCVYRGAGTLCAKDYSTLANTDKQKLMRCAPNFYCADIDDNVFNDRVVREPAMLQTYMYGQEADVLGRPTNYVLAFNNLDLDIKENLEHNAGKIGVAASNLGICRPGKNLSNNNLLDQHSIADNIGRADFINQISSCDSDLTTNARVRTCPLIGTDEDDVDNFGNIVYESANIANAVDRTKQNMCGSEWKDGSDSIFKDIEAGPISSLASLFEPRVAMDACLRRAGSVCHTDLDCGPNRLHAQQALVLDPSSFGAGGNQAEHSYWSESLVCRQAKNVPSVFAEDYEEYDMSLNRCCREIGSEITMYTRLLDALVADDSGVELNILTDGNAPPHGSQYTTGARRYSRYATLKDATTNPNGQALNEPIPVYPANTSVYGGSFNNRAWQWKAINDTGKDTCCGGGWIRKFADGTNDWTNPNRLNLNYTNFKCLNYESTIHSEKPGNIPDGNWQLDQSKLCLSPDQDGCVDKGVKMNDDYEIVVPTSISPTIGTLSTMINDQQEQETNGQAYYQPSIVPFSWGHSNPTNGAMASDFTLFSSQIKNFTHFFLPLYIGVPGNIAWPLGVQFHFKNDAGDEVGPTNAFVLSYSNPGPYSWPAADPGGTNCTAANLSAFAVGSGTMNAPQAGTPFADGAIGVWCSIEITNGGLNYRTFMALANRNIQVNGGPWDYAAVEINFYVYGSNLGNSADSSGNYNNNGIGLRAGNANYYESKLARFELLGIPQIFYEPLYCNSGRETLVTDLFEMDNRSGVATFQASGHQLLSPFVPSGGVTRRTENIYDESTTILYTADASKDANAAPVVFKNQVKHQDIFSGHEFMCCRQLGTKTESASRCCSNFAQNNDNNELVCMLPAKTNLNVYFNKFVSSEGMGEDLPGGGLTDKDFIPETGEPKRNNDVQTKLATLGVAYCQNQAVRNGAAFGSFYPQPNSGSFVGDPEEGRTFGIVDSALDYDPVLDSGAVRFQQGYRWNGHIYCQ
jgi:hypothetical protein